MAKIHSITYAELGRLGVDEDNRLYWDEKLVFIEERLKLAWWVNLAVVVGGLSTFGLLVFEALNFFYHR